MQKSALVTGASGYIAKHIVKDLLAAGWAVRGSVRSNAKAEATREAMKNALPDLKELDENLTFVELDLNKDAGWNEAVRGVDAILHVASPFPMDEPKNELSVINPAVEGALRALRAAEAEGVRRVVMTSSTVAVMNGPLFPDQVTYSERNWSDVNDPRCNAYIKSKTLAEKAAWDFVEKSDKIDLTVINPGFVLGTPIDDDIGTSLNVVMRLLNGKDPALPDLTFVSADVRDISLMHLRALETDESIGKRFIGTERPLSFLAMGKQLKNLYPHRPIPTRRAPKFLLRFLALFDPAIRGILPQLGLRDATDNSAARKILEIEFRDARDALTVSADYLIKRGIVN